MKRHLIIKLFVIFVYLMTTSAVMANSKEAFNVEVNGNNVFLSFKNYKPGKKTSAKRKNSNKKLSKVKRRQNKISKARVKQNSRKFSNQYRTPGIMKVLNKK